jgi:hypothetical protein
MGKSPIMPVMASSVLAKNRALNAGTNENKAADHPGLPYCGEEVGFKDLWEVGQLPQNVSPFLLAIVDFIRFVFHCFVGGVKVRRMSFFLRSFLCITKRKLRHKSIFPKKRLQ